MARSMQAAPSGTAIAKPRADATLVHADLRAAPKSRYTVQSLVMGLRILEALAKNGGLRGVTELARDLSTTKWVIFRHLHTLCEQGFAVRDPVTEKYEVGRRLQSLKDALPSRYVWVHRAREEMMRLRQEVGLTVSVATPLEDRTGVIVVDVESGGRNVLYTLKLGAIFDFHSSAHGKVALAFGDSDLLDLAIRRGLRKVALRTIVTPEGLRREIKRVRELGWAHAPEEAEVNMNALVAPVFSGNGLYEGSIGIFGPIEQIEREPSAALVRSVMAAARRVSERLGGGPQRSSRRR
jgi:IclR family transcriptional regulator, KDG regulon repressor